LSFDLDDVARHADDALDEVLGRVLGIFEHDDVAVLRVGQGQDDLVGEGDMGAVEKLVDEQVVADEQGVEHGARGNLEGLDNEGPDDEGQDQGAGQGFNVFPQHFLPSRIHGRGSLLVFWGYADVSGRRLFVRRP
jgi:hypothetical protein